MNDEPPIPPSVLWLFYGFWVLSIIWSMGQHWVYPLIIFMLGSVILHNSMVGGPLRTLIRKVQSARKVDLRRAQQLTFAGGFFVLLLVLPVVGLVNQQVEARADRAREDEAQLLRQREATARAEEAAQTAKAAAAEQEDKRIKAEQEAKQAAEREAEKKRQEQESAAERQRAQAALAAINQREEAERAAKAAAEAQQRQQDEAERRREEGPFTWSDARNKCRAAVGIRYDTPANTLILQGGFIDGMANGPKNTRFGDGHLWFWHPTFKLAGTDYIINVLCRLYDDGNVEIVEE